MLGEIGFDDLERLVALGRTRHLGLRSLRLRHRRVSVTLRLCLRLQLLRRRRLRLGRRRSRGSAIGPPLGPRRPQIGRGARKPWSFIRRHDIDHHRIGRHRLKRACVEIHQTQRQNPDMADCRDRQSVANEALQSDHTRSSQCRCTLRSSYRLPQVRVGFMGGRLRRRLEANAGTSRFGSISVDRYCCCLAHPVDIAFQFSSSNKMSWAPFHKHSLPSAVRFSLPLVMVRK